MEPNAQIHVLSHIGVPSYIHLIKIFRIHQFHVVLVLRICGIQRIHIREIRVLGVFQLDESGLCRLPASLRAGYVFIISDQ